MQEHSVAIDGSPITFDRTYYEYDSKRQAVRFSAYQGSQSIPCYISREALTDCFQIQGEQGNVTSIGSVGEQRYNTEEEEAACLSLFEQQRTSVQYIQAGLTKTYRREDGCYQIEVVLRRKDFC